MLQSITVGHAVIDIIRCMQAWMHTGAAEAKTSSWLRTVRMVSPRWMRYVVRPKDAGAAIHPQTNIS